METCAEELEEHARAWENEPLTLDKAAGESGYSYSSLQQKVASGALPNLGEKGKPLVR